MFAGTYKQLEKVRQTLEKKFGDVQDFEFTVEKKKLYMLQTRNGKRTALAYVKIAHDMVKQKLMTPRHAILSADPDALSQLLAPIFDRKAYEAAKKEGRVLTTGLPAGPGAATGELVFTAGKAEELAHKGKKVVLFSVPGAFTPTCSARHLPGFKDHREEMAAKGVDTIACISVNDAFVMGAWADSQGIGKDEIVMLGDGNGDLTRQLGLTMDAKGFGMGERSQRYSMIVKDGVVSQLNIEQPGEFRVSSAEHLLAQL
jgi:peroxiredoxin